MNPGLDLDALVAEKVMGCRLKRLSNALANHNDQKEYEYLRHHKVEYWCGCPANTHMDTDWEGSCVWLKQYSTDIAAAWEVVESFGRLDLLLNPESKWSAMLTGPGDRSFAETAPLAICLAALKAKGIKV